MLTFYAFDVWSDRSCTSYHFHRRNGNASKKTPKKLFAKRRYGDRQSMRWKVWTAFLIRQTQWGLSCLVILQSHHNVSRNIVPSLMKFETESVRSVLNRRTISKISKQFVSKKFKHLRVPRGSRIYSTIACLSMVEVTQYRLGCNCRPQQTLLL